jgi:FixJ family two-component response regulator
MRDAGLAVISIVDDDASVRGATRSLLRSFGYQADAFESAELFLNSGALQGTDCLIVDVRMPGIDGLELQRRLNIAESRVPIIFISAHDDGPARQKAIEGGAVDFFRKPFDAKALVAAIETSQRGMEQR